MGFKDWWNSKSYITKASIIGGIITFIIGAIAFPINLISVSLIGGLMGFGAENQGQNFKYTLMIYGLILFLLGSLIGFIYGKIKSN